MSEKRYRFKAKIEPARGGGTFVFFPYDTDEEFGTKGKVPVKAKFGDIDYTGPLVRYGFPQHMLHVPKAIREELGKQAGDTLDVVLWKDDEVRALEIPADLEQMMKRAGLRGFFDSLSYTHRKEYCRWISEAKKEETRAKRLEKAESMMKAKVKTPG